jgi:hypothetical protein
VLQDDNEMNVLLKLLQLKFFKGIYRHLLPIRGVLHIITICGVITEREENNLAYKYK